VQPLIAKDTSFPWNPFEGEENLQTSFEFNIQSDKIYYDISLIPNGCDDISHLGSSWQSNLGWGRNAACSPNPANAINLPSCPCCKDNKTGPAFNYGGLMTCDSGGLDYSCLGPVQGSWSTGTGQGWPTFCGYADANCEVSNFSQPTIANKGCPQAYFHPRYYAGYGDKGQPSVIPQYLPVKIVSDIVGVANMVV